MKLSDFKFEIPKKLIALHPPENRDESRLMVIHKDTGKIEHKVFNQQYKGMSCKTVWKQRKNRGQDRGFFIKRTQSGA